MQNPLEASARYRAELSQFFSSTSTKIAESDAIKFIVNHEQILSDASLVALDIFSLLNAPYAFTTCFVVSFLAKEGVHTTCEKVVQFWNDHSHARPVLFAGAVFAGSLNCHLIVSVSCGVFSAIRLWEKPEATSFKDRAFLWCSSWFDQKKQ